MSRVGTLDPHTRAMARANGAAKGLRLERQRDLVRFANDELRRQLGLRGKRLTRRRKQ